ncbi:hypothetical protein [Modestobacter sp. NPDC049651]
MSRTADTLSRWTHRTHRRWVPDTRDPEWSAGRLINGARPGRGA